ncbi:hypothetical protein FHG87_004159 [Trinorchestia longiramus]|nr:hypothetical protein FHG87_004159 [Trinorchestia longiramus]
MAFFQYCNVLLGIFNIYLSLISTDCIHFHSPLERGKLGGSGSHGFRSPHFNASREDLNNSEDLSSDNPLLGWYHKEIDKTSFNRDSKNSSYDTSHGTDDALISPLNVNHQINMKNTALTTSIPATTSKKPSKKSKQKARNRNRQREKSQQTSEKPAESMSSQSKEFNLVSNATSVNVTTQPSAGSPALLVTNLSKAVSTAATMLDARHYDIDEQPQSSSRLQNSSVANDYSYSMNKSSQNPQINAHSQQMHLTFAWVIVPVLAIASVAVFGVCYWRKEKQRQFEYMSQQLLPNYSYNAADDQDDWENKLISESMALKSKVQVSSPSCDQDSNVVEV